MKLPLLMFFFVHLHISSNENFCRSSSVCAETILTYEVEIFWFAAHDLRPSSIYGIWRIDDTDNSFSTQPFRIRYARQDIHLCMMISFNLSLDRFEVMIYLYFFSFYRVLRERKYWPMPMLGAQLSVGRSPRSYHYVRC